MKLATLCYVRSDGKTLMLHRVKKQNDIHQGKWNGVGGKFEAGETPEQCAVREIQEECGLRATRLELKGFLTFPEFSKGEDWYVFVFVVTAFTGELRECKEGNLAWIADGDILQLPLWEGDRYFIPCLDRPGMFSGMFRYRDGKLVEHHMQVYGQRIDN